MYTPKYNSCLDINNNISFQCLLAVETYLQCTLHKAIAMDGMVIYYHNLLSVIESFGIHYMYTVNCHTIDSTKTY